VTSARRLALLSPEYRRELLASAIYLWEQHCMGAGPPPDEPDCVAAAGGSAAAFGAHASSSGARGGADGADGAGGAGGGGGAAGRRGGGGEGGVDEGALLELVASLPECTPVDVLSTAADQSWTRPCAVSVPRLVTLRFIARYVQLAQPLTSLAEGWCRAAVEAARDQRTRPSPSFQLALERTQPPPHSTVLRGIHRGRAARGCTRRHLRR